MRCAIRFIRLCIDFVCNLVAQICEIAVCVKTPLVAGPAIPVLDVNDVYMHKGFTGNSGDRRQHMLTFHLIYARVLESCSLT